ncbi:carbohydrate ABC transporter permease [Hamadaea tsunoensis]|uniref:carbohydrate ABC transporter permease n=1 Tax=Hamadaea tsunoensis TaxID=53368 RepID=UPI00041DE129|nr:carbohydrate ABC transporter permease [Hamadaea tsunoensis]
MNLHTATARRTTDRTRRRRVGAWITLMLLMAVTLFPFYWMLRTALSNNRSLPSDPGSLLPVDFTWGPFKRVLGLSTLQQAQAEGGSGAELHFWRYLLNTVIVATTITAGQVWFCSMAAYAFARLRWRGRDKVFFAFLTALMVPPVFTVLPNFLLMKDLGLLNTYAAIVLPYFFMTPFAVFFMRQFFLGISKEVEEAARLDGAGPARRFFSIILPMSWAPITTLALLTYITAWNEYFWPLIAGSKEESRVLTVALASFRQSTPGIAPDWAGLMAASLVAAAPILLLFLIFGRKVVNSIGFSGLK